MFEHILTDFAHITMCSNSFSSSTPLKDLAVELLGRLQFDLVMIGLFICSWASTFYFGTGAILNMILPATPTPRS